MKTKWTNLIVICSAVTVVHAAVALAEQDEPSGGSTPPAQVESDELAVEQGAVADRFKRLEAVILKLAELSDTTDPRRAAILRQAVAQSRERGVGANFESIVDLLENERLAHAVKDQKTLKQDLEKLLELLLKENRAGRIESEKRRIRRLLKTVGRIIKQQRGVKARTEGGDDLPRLKQAQGKITGKTDRLAKEIADDLREEDGSAEKDETQDAEKDEANRGEPKDREPEKDSDGQKDSDGKDQDGDRAGQSNGAKDGDKQGESGKDGDGKSGEGKSGEGKSGEQSDGQAGEGQSSEGQNGAGEQGDQQTEQQKRERQLQRRIRTAAERMREAEQKLEQAKRKGAAEEQQKALAELEKAKAELEKILRQLREEEIIRTLASLEARFRKMLKMQVAVHEGTLRLDRVAEAERSRGHEIEAGRLSRREAEIVREADRAITLLREEGSSAAFPEAAVQMRDDMQQVVVRLAKAKTGTITQGLEEDIIAALEEIVAALKKALKQAEQANQSPSPAAGEPVEPPLVDALAELRMIRTLQMRVNKRTARYSKMIEGDQALQPELLEALDGLAERQRRIHELARDLHLQRNQ